MPWTAVAAARNSAPGQASMTEAGKVLSAYYVGWKLGAAGAEACRRGFGRPFLQSYETDAAQVRREIWDRPPHQQNFAVQCGDEARDGHAFQRCYLPEDVPEYPFESDACALAVEPNRTGLVGVAVWVLAGE